MKRKSTFRDIQNLSKKIVENIIESDYTGKYRPDVKEKYQAVNSSVFTPLNDYVHKNSKNIRQEERLDTIVKLARNLNDNELSKAFNILGYQITLPEDMYDSKSAFVKCKDLVRKALNKHTSEDERKSAHMEIFKLSPELDDEEREEILLLLEDKSILDS